MPIVGTHQDTYYGDFYAIGGAWVDPVSQEDLDDKVKFIRTHIRNLTVSFNPPDDPQATLDWRLLRDSLLPASNDWVDGELNFKYNVPLRKTRNGGNNFDMNIVNLAALHVAQKIETRTFAASGMPAQSEYGLTLEMERDARLIDVKEMRLRGQRLKANNRTFDPNMEPVSQPGVGGSQGKGNFTPKANPAPDA